MDKKQTTCIIAVLLVALIIYAMALLTIQRTVDNSVKIKAVGLEVTPTSIVWDDFIEGEQANQTKTLTINNTRNIDLNITFSDDLAYSGLSMQYPNSFILSQYSAIDKNVTLLYDGVGSYGSTTFVVTVLGTED